MIVYRVLTEEETLAGKTGKVLLTLEAALITAREQADYSRVETAIYKYNTDTKGIDLVTTVRAHPSVRKNVNTEHVARMKKQREETERKRRLHEKFMHEQRLRYEEFTRNYNNPPKSQPQVKTRLEVAMSNLGLKSGFDQATLKTQYRVMAKKYHPDLGGKPEHFMWIAKSYEYILEVKGWK